jgi:hypothetical protein
MTVPNTKIQEVIQLKVIQSKETLEPAKYLPRYTNCMDLSISRPVNDDSIDAANTSAFPSIVNELRVDFAIKDIEITKKEESQNSWSATSSILDAEGETLTTLELLKHKMTLLRFNQKRDEKEKTKALTNILKSLRNAVQKSDGSDEKEDNSKHKNRKLHKDNPNFSMLPLQLAVAKKCHRIVERLLKSGAVVNGCCYFS